jgi:osmoprotectant transport system ATP-binding protein
MVAICDGERGFRPLAYLEFTNVSYSAGNQLILRDISFRVDRGQTLVFLGRSGSGKTTALRLINRMLEPSGGKIQIDGRDISQVDPIELRRQIGYVIQDFGLLPHWTVEQNVGLVPQLLRWEPERARNRARELLTQVGLDAATVGPRMPYQLSGGQRQRVGVARALAAEPLLLLFDEPFGALDPVTRHEMQELFLKLRTQYGGVSVFVTHDLAEAITVGTQIAVLGDGQLEAIYTPDQFLRAETPVARSFLDTLPRQLTNLNAPDQGAQA